MHLCISEDEQIPPLASKVVAESKWDDEDVDESDVKESWEDDDEPTPVWFITYLVCTTNEMSIAKNLICSSSESVGRIFCNLEIYHI